MVKNEIPVRLLYKQPGHTYSVTVKVRNGKVIKPFDKVVKG